MTIFVPARNARTPKNIEFVPFRDGIVCFYFTEIDNLWLAFRRCTLNKGVRISGFDTLTFEKGQTYGTVAIVTNLPATIEIPMADPDVPQVGMIRSIFVKKNADFGNYSPNCDVTLA